ncbi:MAG: hypothetical protein WC796_04420 [Candidatus Pacearchaeota archaeon]|jgi:hypothetical protein
MYEDVIEALKVCARDERASLLARIGGHRYRHFNIDEFPNMFDDVHREEQHEYGGVPYAIVHQSQPYGDDTLLVRWDPLMDAWTMSFAAMGCQFKPRGDLILGDDDPHERAALTILAQFGLIKRRNEFHPTKVGFISPFKLEQLAANVDDVRSL